MGYRRPDQQHAGSDRWQHEHRADLLRWLPVEIVDSNRSLNYVLLHAEDSVGTGWTPDWLEPEEARSFLTFLETEFRERAGYDIFRALSRRADARNP